MTISCTGAIKTLTKTVKPSSLRIIGGIWRGSKVSFAELAQVRPSPSRVRETLFNWLQGGITGKSCLDLFSGSGILSFEALSRGAGQVVLVDQDPTVCNQQRNSFKQLKVTDDLFSIYCSTAEQYLGQRASQAFDLIFMDPPFRDGNYQQLTQTIIDNQWLKRGGLIYIESGISLGQNKRFSELTILKQKQAGKVHFALLGRDNER